MPSLVATIEGLGAGAQVAPLQPATRSSANASNRAGVRAEEARRAWVRVQNALAWNSAHPPGQQRAETSLAALVSAEIALAAETLARIAERRGQSWSAYSIARKAGSDAQARALAVNIEALTRLDSAIASLHSTRLARLAAPPQGLLTSEVQRRIVVAREAFAFEVRRVAASEM